MLLVEGKKYVVHCKSKETFALEYFFKRGRLVAPGIDVERMGALKESYDGE